MTPETEALREITRMWGLEERHHHTTHPRIRSAATHAPTSVSAHLAGRRQAIASETSVVAGRHAGPVTARETEHGPLTVHPVHVMHAPTGTMPKLMPGGAFAYVSQACPGFLA